MAVAMVLVPVPAVLPFAAFLVQQIVEQSWGVRQDLDGGVQEARITLVVKAGAVDAPRLGLVRPVAEGGS